LIIVIIGTLATIAMSYLLGQADEASRSAITSDRNAGYKKATLYEKENPGASVTLAILKARGYSSAKNVTLTVVDGNMDSPTLTATHPGSVGVYMIDHQGRISKR
jgi:hypothetical protein